MPRRSSVVRRPTGPDPERPPAPRSASAPPARRAGDPALGFHFADLAISPPAPAASEPAQPQAPIQMAGGTGREEHGAGEDGAGSSSQREHINALKIQKAYRQHRFRKLQKRYENSMVKSKLARSLIEAQHVMPRSPERLAAQLEAADSLARKAKKAREVRQETGAVGFKTSGTERPLRETIPEKWREYETNSQGVPPEDRLTREEAALVTTYTSSFYDPFNVTHRQGPKAALNKNIENKDLREGSKAPPATRDLKHLEPEERKEAHDNLAANMDLFKATLRTSLEKLDRSQKTPEGKNLASEGYDPHAAVYRLEGAGSWNEDRKKGSKDWHDAGATSAAREVGGALEGSEQQEVLNIIDNSIGADVSKFSHFGPEEKEKLLAPDQEFETLARLSRDKNAEPDVGQWLETLTRQKGGRHTHPQVAAAMSGLSKQQKRKFRAHLDTIAKQYKETRDRISAQPDSEERTKKLEQLKQMHTVIWSQGTGKYFEKEKS